MSLHAKRKATTAIALTFTGTDPKLRAADVARLDRQAGHLGARFHTLIEHDGRTSPGRPPETAIPGHPESVVISCVGTEETQTQAQRIALIGVLREVHLTYPDLDPAN